MITISVVKKMLLEFVIRSLTAIVSLMVLSLLTYGLKWQAPQAQAGITVTYIISGLAGGFASCRIRKGTQRKKEKGSTDKDFERDHSLKNNLIYGVTQGTIYMAVLLSISILISANESWDMIQILLIWILMCVSSILGIFVGDKGLLGLVKKC